MKKNPWNPALAAVAVLLGLFPAALAGDASDAETSNDRLQMSIPNEERTMSATEVMGLLGRADTPWAADAVRLRIESADQPARAELYGQLANLVASTPAGAAEPSLGAAAAATSLLGQQAGHRDEAIPALREAAKTPNLVIRDLCHQNIGKLGGLDAIDILKQAILAGPPQNA